MHKFTTIFPTCTQTSLSQRTASYSAGLQIRTPAWYMCFYEYSMPNQELGFRTNVHPFLREKQNPQTHNE